MVVSDIDSGPDLPEIVDGRPIKRLALEESSDIE